jgi:hypothetical protein
MTGCGSQSAEIRFGTAGTGGTYYAYGTAMSELLSARLENASFDVKTTAGSAANLRLLSEDYLQLAIAQSDMTGDAWTGEGVFAGQTPRSGYGAVASLYTEPCQLVARADAGIRSVADLRGKTVSVGQDESGVVQNAEQILLAYGLSFTMLHVRTDLSYSDAAAALADGTIDAFFCTAGAPTNAVANLARQTDVVLVGLESDKVDSLLDTYGDYAACTIPAGTYEGQDEDVETIGVRALLLASSKLSEDRVYQITAALFENADALQMATAADTPLSLEDAPEGVTIPFHSGAAKFYAEKGITVEVSE